MKNNISSSNFKVGFWQNNYLVHAAVTYADCPSVNPEIKICAVRSDTSIGTSSIMTLNTYSTGWDNTEPKVVVHPYEDVTHVVWNFDGIPAQSSGFDVEGLTHIAHYNTTTVDFTNGSIDDWQVNDPAISAANVPYSTGSSFSEYDLLYFYYDDVIEQLFYKLKNYGSSLRMANTFEATKSGIAYPNPFTNELKIRSDAPIERITIKDLSGKIYYESDAVEIINLKLLPGIYFLELIQTNGNSLFQKVIRQ